MRIRVWIQWKRSKSTAQNKQSLFFKILNIRSQLVALALSDHLFLHSLVDCYENFGQNDFIVVMHYLRFLVVLPVALLSILLFDDLDPKFSYARSKA